MGTKNIKANIYRIRATDSKIREYVCVRFTSFMLKRKRLLDYTNLFSPKEYEKNDEITLKYFEWL